MFMSNYNTLTNNINNLGVGWDQECSVVARYDTVLNLPMSDTGAY